MREKNSIIPKGTSICHSEVGHNNFYYPRLNKCTILTEDVEVREMYWVGGGELTAYKVVGQKNIVWTEKRHVKENQ